MPTGRRLASLLVVLALVALPAVALRAFCIGQSCTTTEATAAIVPFCPLPAPVRAAIAAGFREGRSPDALGVTSGETPGVATSVAADVEVPWPSVEPPLVDGRGASNDTRVPIVFFGGGFTGSAPPDGTGTDQIAPTLAQAIGFRMPHPDVRTGTPAPGVADGEVIGSAAPPLVVQVVWKGVGSTDLEGAPGAWPFLRSLVDASGTLEGTTGSLPIDPAATLTTIGTGGIPSQHGITGTTLRADDGTVARAWSRRAPTSVIATLADELDAATDQRARVAGVLTETSDRGLIGDGWYASEHDRDDVIIARRPLPAVASLLRGGHGSDPGPGVIGVVIEGSISDMDRMTRQLVRVVRAGSPFASFVITATGSAASPAAMSADDLVEQAEARLGAPVIAAAGSGGLFLDRNAAAERSITAAAVATAMGAARTPDGEALFADTFPSFAVSFSRYC